MPRSPSRDLADRYAGNRRYFRRWTALDRWKVALAVAALVAGLGWAAADYLGVPGRFAAYQHTHGPVASVHAAWDNNCAACHKQHAPGELGVSVLDAGTRWRDFTCEKCHAGAAFTGPDPSAPDAAKGHHATAKWPAGADQTCGNCHHDHNGRDFSLVRLSDAACTQCHADLAAHHVAGRSVYANRIIDFATHPEFRAVDQKQQRSGLAFSHAQHLAPGVSRTPGGKEAWAVKDIPVPELRERYLRAGQKDTDLVQLDCASCHQPDSQGAYYQPVSFEQSCRACHPIQSPAVAVRPGGPAVEAFELPHARPYPELKRLIEGEYARRLLAEKQTPLAGRDDLTWRPDKPAPEAVVKAREDVTRLAKDALERVVGSEQGKRSGCVLCHGVEVLKVYPSQPVAVGGMSLVPLQPHAKFDHAAHRMMSCQGCHPGAYAALPAASAPLVERGPLDLPGVQSCRECHAPAGTKDGAAVGGVRHGCTDCHRYHGGDFPHAGRGSAAFAPTAAKTAREFLSGP